MPLGLLIEWGTFICSIREEIYANWRCEDALRSAKGKSAPEGERAVGVESASHACVDYSLEYSRSFPARFGKIES